MALSRGDHLGPYEVLAPLGAGGMGEVYRARDPRLDRDVAIKVLPEDVAGDPDRLRRFEKEAKAAGALNHPNILAVHDVGTHDGRPYLVTELLEGDTLRERLAEAALPAEKAVEHAVQIARGLAAAHDKGIVHRDLKPENLFVTKDGLIKILDFGLAKLRGPRGQPHGSGDDVETASRTTDPGAVIGTAGYMSPEQVRGRVVDHRSDIFSFGAVLYEMLSGRRAFRGDSGVEVLNAILKEEPPDIAELGRDLPPQLTRTLKRCLEKRAQDRFQSARDLAFGLEAVSTDELRRVKTLPRPEVPVERPPYPGLAAFGEDDAEHFFGREAEVEALWEKLHRNKLLGLIGPSGAGKTSFVQAGVLPARPEGWAAIVCTPGRGPLMGLARALAPEVAGDAEAVERLLRFADPEVALSTVAQWRRGHGDALVVVDQFEELFTLNPPEVQKPFASLLGRLATEADVHVLLSLRDDFLVPTQEHPPLRPLTSELTVLLALSGDDLRRALVEPAKKRSYRFEDDALVDEMTSLVEGNRGTLPLLAFTAARLWEKKDRDRKLLTREAYSDIGGVEGALAQHAEATMGRIGAERQGLVREIFRNLATAQGTRAVIDREELLSVFPDQDAAKDVLGQLIDARLLTSYEVEGKDDEPGHHRVEIVHESLLKAWPRLVRWQAQDEEGALLRDQLKQAAHLWDERGRTPDLLWSGTAFREFELWRERYAGALTALEEDFARSMREKARRKKRLVRAAVAVALVGTATVAVVVGVLRHQAVRQAQRAEREARLALASKLVALGRSELERFPAATLAYARKSLEIADNAEGRRLAVEALWRSPSLRVLPVEGGTYNFAFSSDGTRLAAYTFADTVLLYPDDGSPPTAIGGFPTSAGGGADLAFTPKGDALLGWWPGGPIRMVSIPDGREIRRFEPQLPSSRTPHGRAAHALFVWQMTPRGILIASRDGDAPDAMNHLRLEPYGDGAAAWVGAFRRPPGAAVDEVGERLALLRGRSVRIRPVAGDERTPEREVARLESAGGFRLAFSPDRERLAVAELDVGRLTLWPVDPLSSRPDRVLTQPNPSWWPVFDATGTRLAWGSGAERAGALWGRGAPPDAGPRVIRRPDAERTVRSVFDPHGSWLTVSHQDSVTFWAIAQPWPRILSSLGNEVYKLRFTSDSRRLVSCAIFDGVSVWPLDPAVAPARRQLADQSCFGLEVTPDDRKVLWGGLGVRLTSIEDGPLTELLPAQQSDESTFAIAIDASGRWGASASTFTQRSVRKKIRIWDLLTGRSVREWSQAPDGEPDHGVLWTAVNVAFLADGRVIVGQTGGVRLLDPRTGASEWLWKLPATEVAAVAARADGRRAVAVRMPLFGKTEGIGEILLFDFATGARRSIASHGARFGRQLALDASGSVLVTGGVDGAVRVGPTDGHEPHLLCCHAGMVGPLAVSPDGRWIASASGGEIRLWPMPDLSKPPLHTLPHDELIAKLRALTNLQVVEDATSPTGYELEIGPFPGWKDVPAW